MKTVLFSSMIGLAISAVAAAQAPVHPPVPAVEAQNVEKHQKRGNGEKKHDKAAQQNEQECCGEGNDFKIDVASDVNIFKFDKGTIVEVDTTFSYAISNKWTLDVAVPIYNDSGQGKSETGLGDIDFALSYDLYDGDWKFLNSDKTWIDITTGLSLPIDGEYASGDLVYSLGGVVGAKWDRLSVSYDADYQFVDEFTFVPQLGGFAFSDVYSGVLSAKYNLEKDLCVGLNLSHFASSEDSIALLGPSLEYKFAKNGVLNAELGVPVADNIDNDELDVVLSAGIKFEF